MKSPIEKFKLARASQISKYAKDENFMHLSKRWLENSMKNRYVYNFDWLGRPIIQYPQDMVAMQELIWKIKPDLIIETGIAHGGSLILSASMLALIEMSEAIENKKVFDPKKAKRMVIGIDIDIRSHNRDAILNHPMASWVQMIEGSSTDKQVVQKVSKLVKDGQTVLVALDSSHTHSHVLAELEAYASMTSIGSYCVVFDTFVADMPEDMFPDRPWGPDNNAKSAVHEFLKKNSNFQIDKNIQNKLQITVAPDGFLRRFR